MSLIFLSDILLDSQSAMFLPLNPSQCIVNLLSTLGRTKTNMMQMFFVSGPVSLKLQPTQKATKKLVSTKSPKKLNELQCLFLFNLFI